jgi:ATP-dependent Lon protease
LQCSRTKFNEYCVRPAVDLRQRVRDELHKLDAEYAIVQIGYE